MTILFFLGRNFGMFVAVVLGLLWWFFPAVAVSILNANLEFVGWISKILPADLGGQLLGGLVALMKALGNGAKFVGSFLPPTFGPRTEATIRIVVETLLLLGEIKLIRWTYNICWALWWLTVRPLSNYRPDRVPVSQAENVTFIRKTGTR